MTGRNQRIGLCVGSRPSQVRASIGRDCRGCGDGHCRLCGPGSGRAAGAPDCRAMTDTPWLGDACSLVDAFRSGRASPAEELEAILAAIDASDLNAVPFLDADAARARAADADVALPFGGVPIGVKELDPVDGWPSTEASLVFADRVADHTATMVSRAESAGVVTVGQTTGSEFGGLNVGVTRLHGVTHNPWQHGRTPGGSSGGSRGGGRRRAGPARHGRRRRRLDPHPGGVHRPRRDEGHGGPHPSGPAHRDRAAHGGGRVPGPFGPRRRPLVRRVRRLRRPRPLQPAEDRGLGARSRLARPAGTHRRHRARPGQRRRPPGGRRGRARGRRGARPGDGAAPGRRAGATAGPGVRVGDDEPGPAAARAGRRVAGMQGAT